MPEPEAFFIDIDICMNCGFCAEFCPFDAIKMDHDYELSSYDRTSQHIYDKEKLSKEFRYWRTIAPTTAYEEMEARGGWEHTDVIKARKKAEQAAAKAAQVVEERKEATTTPDPVNPEAAAKQQDDDAAKAERLAKREAALARKRAREAEGSE